MKASLVFFIVLAAAASCSAMRIIDGSSTTIAEHPYQAPMRINSQHNCGSVLISATRSLTAAHCGGGPISTYSILAGTGDRTQDTCSTCAIRFPLRNFIRHANFSNNPTIGYPNDIAIAEFYSIATNANIRYAALATDTEQDFAGQQCVITGWGREVAGGPLPNLLNRGSLTVLPNDQCGSHWGFNRISPDHLCASDPVNAACGGDNGGPLVCNGLVVGIFSWGEANCSPSLPSVFVRVSSYNDWINSFLMQEEVEEDASLQF